jgi:hypothetical protein
MPDPPEYEHGDYEMNAAVMLLEASRHASMKIFSG